MRTCGIVRRRGAQGCMRTWKRTTVGATRADESVKLKNKQASERPDRRCEALSLYRDLKRLKAATPPPIFRH